MTQQEAPNGNKYPRLALIVAAATFIPLVLSFFGLIFNLREPLGDVNVTIRVIEREPIMTSEDAQAPGRHVDLEVHNYGSKPIGVERLWTLFINTTATLSIDTVGELKRSLREYMLNVSSNEGIALEIGLFNPGDKLTLRLDIRDHDQGQQPKFAAGTRVPGLSIPIVSYRNLFILIFFRIVWPNFFLMLAISTPVYLWIIWSEFIRDKA